MGRKINIVLNEGVYTLKSGVECIHKLKQKEKNDEKTL